MEILKWEIIGKCGTRSRSGDIVANGIVPSAIIKRITNEYDRATIDHLSVKLLTRAFRANLI